MVWSEFFSLKDSTSSLLKMLNMADKFGCVSTHARHFLYPQTAVCGLLQPSLSGRTRAEATCVFDGPDPLCSFPFATWPGDRGHDISNHWRRKSYWRIRNFRLRLHVRNLLLLCRSHVGEPGASQSHTDTSSRSSPGAPTHSRGLACLRKC